MEPTIVESVNSKKFNVYCHTHNSCSNPLNMKGKKKLVESIIQKTEDKWATSMKKIVAEIKEEIIAEICNSDPPSNGKISKPKIQDVNLNESAETLSFPLTLSELEDSSEVEYDICNENYQNNEESDYSSSKKRKIGFEKIVNSKRQKNEIGLEAHNYLTPTHIRSSSPLKRIRVAKALSFTSCSESDESIIVIESDDSDEDGDYTAFTPPKRWNGSTSLNMIYESPESGCSVRTMQLQCGSSDDSPSSSKRSVSMTPEKDNCDGAYKDQSYDDEEPIEEAIDFRFEFLAPGPTFKMYTRTYSSKLDTIAEEDEEENI